jgi:hypothetical protein
MRKMLAAVALTAMLAMPAAAEHVGHTPYEEGMKAAHAILRAATKAAKRGDKYTARVLAQLAVNLMDTLPNPPTTKEK